MSFEIKNCQNCKQEFVIEADDLNFYQKIQVPPPTFCPLCRLQRRIVWRNERALYKRPCGLCGTHIIAMYPEDAPPPVYCRQCWFSDKWDPLAYGRAYDFKKPFFTQFYELLQVTPRVALQVDRCVNCEYTNQIVNCKDCYLTFSANEDIECNYTYRVNFCKNVHDSFVVFESENSYEAIECRTSSGLQFCQNISGSLDMLFCYDANDSQHCFMTSNVRRASYYFRNEPITKEEYRRRMANIETGSYKKLQEYKREFDSLRLKTLRRFAIQKNVVNSAGHAISNAKNAYYCFNGINLENCRYCFFVNNGRDAMDINNGDGMENCYENSTNGINAYGVKFSTDAWPEVRELEYCDSCRGGVSNLLGCISVQKRQYCILNKQYSKDEYEALAAKIRQHMNEMPYIDTLGRRYTYGEFFPTEIAPFAYNETMAHDYFPLTRDEALAQGYKWKEAADRNVNIDISVNDLPDHIRDVREDTVGKIIGCAHAGQCNEKCTIGFKILMDELQMYKAKNIALPRLCPNCRHYARLKQSNPMQLWHRRCMCNGKTSLPNLLTSDVNRLVYTNSTSHFHGENHCPNEFETTYAPERPEIVYCEACYNSEVV